MKDLKAVVVGAGALGNEVVKTLGLLGIGELRIVDPDVIEPSNLTRSVLFRTEDASGRSKALALAEAAATLFPDTAMNGIPREIADVGWRDLSGADILFGCVDSDLARLEIAYIGVRLDKPVCDGGLGGQDYSRGRVSYSPGNTAACFGCQLTPRRRRELLTLWEATVHPCWEVGAANGAYPSTPTMASIVGALQVEVGLRRLLERYGQTVVTEISLDGTPRLEEFQAPQSSSCPFHSIEGELIAAPATPVEEWLIGPGATLVLDWPLCLSARCASCGFEWSPRQRLALFRRKAACPGCGSRSIDEVEVLQSLRRESTWARCTLSELGVPERHLSTIQFPRGAAG